MVTKIWHRRLACESRTHKQTDRSNTRNVQTHCMIITTSPNKRANIQHCNYRSQVARCESHSHSCTCLFTRCWELFIAVKS